MFLQGSKFGPVSYEIWNRTCNFQIRNPTGTTQLRKKEKDVEIQL